MYIKEGIQKNVAFIASRKYTTKSDYEEKLRGTCFFVGIPLDDSSTNYFLYAITAKHVVSEDSEGEKFYDGKIYIRVMNAIGTLDYLETQKSDWYSHPSDANCDVAVYPLEHFDFDFKYFRIDSFATTEVVAELNIGPGDDCFICGLFPSHAGKTTNIPLFRFGNIAAMPNEKVSTKKFGDIDAYLLESYSSGGLSGSPVFVTIDPNMYYTEQKGQRLVIGLTPGERQPEAARLLGLMHGHWDIDRTDEAKINMGISIVIPAWKILEVLEHPTLKDNRVESIAQNLKPN